MKPIINTSKRIDASTRVEVFVLIIALSLLLGIALLSQVRLANGGPAKWTGCVNNQKQLTLAFVIWANDHKIVDQGNLPWRVPRSRGGTEPDEGNRITFAWKEFLSISNELPNPRVLVCPSDKERDDNQPKDWGTSRKGGFRHAKYRDNALSYFLNLDCGIQTGQDGIFSGWELAQSQVLLGDRNLQVDAQNVQCSSRINNASRVITEPIWKNTKWTNAIHGFKGILAVVDGSVSMNNQSQMEDLMRQSNDDGSAHLLIP